ncbi:MAG TPA: helicase-related protein [Patescibacteria group bacterium]|nr:helicase-related protein [Patescibacteria group bacterium]
MSNLNWELLNEKELEYREYQIKDAEFAARSGLQGRNSGLIYPTGAGKTPTAIMAASAFLSKGRVFFLTPTNPLCQQILKSCRQMYKLPEEKINLLVGGVPMKKRAELWQNSQVIVATPQTVVSELKKGRIDLSETVLAIFDEMHMAGKDYDYVQIAEYCQKADVRVLGLTASGGDLGKIMTLRENLNLDFWIYRSLHDVRRFTFPKKEKPLILGYPEEHQKAMISLRKTIIYFHNGLAGCGIIQPIVIQSKEDYERRIDFLRITELNELKEALWSWVEEQKGLDRNKQVRWYDYVMFYSAYYKLMHLLNLFVTEGYESAYCYLVKDIWKKAFWPIDESKLNLPQTPEFLRLLSLKRKKNKKLTVNAQKAAKQIWNNMNFQKFRRALDDLVRQGIDHPKISKFLEVVTRYVNDGENLLIFSNFKDSLEVLAKKLSKAGIDCQIVAGKAHVSDTRRQEIIQQFKQGRFPVLLATTVIEAGIHLPKIDVVVNYSMPLTGIAMIQRRGRAGRANIGLIYYLIMDDSNDTSLYFAGRANIKNMHRQMTNISKQQKMVKKNPETKVLFSGKTKPLPFDLDSEPDEEIWIRSAKKSRTRTCFQKAKKRKEPELFPEKQGGAK